MLKAIMLKKKQEALQGQLDQLRTAAADFTKREADLEARIQADNLTEEQRTALEGEVNKFEAERAANAADQERLTGEIAGVAAELASLEAQPAPQPEERQQQLGGVFNPNTTPNLEQRARTFQNTRKLHLTAGEIRSAILGGSAKRSTTMGSGQIAAPTGASGINDTLNAVPSIVNMVQVEDCSGMSSDQVAYVDTEAAAGTQSAEGEEYGGTGSVFKYVEIKPTTVTVVDELSRQVRHQSPLAYQAKVQELALKALLRKVAGEITGAIQSSELAKKTELALNETFLRKLTMSYGGDDAIMSPAVLQITKNDLMTLGDLVDKKGDDVYEITPSAANPNTGIIKRGGTSVTYLLDSHLTDGTQVYGAPADCFKLDLFSDYVIEALEEVKRTKGMIQIVGDVEVGGTVIVKDGYVVNTKPAE